MNSNDSAPNVSYEEAGYGAVANGTDGRYGFVSEATEAYDAMNATLFEEAAGRLHVMLFNFAPYQGQSGLWSQKALCVRADPRQLSVENGGADGSEEAGSGGGSDDSQGEGNSATTFLPGTGTKGVTLALAGVWLGMVALL